MTARPEEGSRDKADHLAQQIGVRGSFPISVFRFIVTLVIDRFPESGCVRSPTLTDEPSMTNAQPLAAALWARSRAAPLPSSCTIIGDAARHPDLIGNRP